MYLIRSKICKCSDRAQQNWNLDGCFAGHHGGTLLCHHIWPELLGEVILGHEDVAVTRGSAWEWAPDVHVMGLPEAHGLERGREWSGLQSWSGITAVDVQEAAWAVVLLPEPVQDFGNTEPSIHSQQTSIRTTLSPTAATWTASALSRRPCAGPKTEKITPSPPRSLYFRVPEARKPVVDSIQEEPAAVDIRTQMSQACRHILDLLRQWLK